MKLNPKKFFLIAGPCVAESKKVCFEIASHLKEIENALKIQIIFKASYSKSNRSSSNSYRGPGIKKGLQILSAIKNKFNFPVLTDVHESHEINEVAKVADIIQIPAFLCRQTILLEEAAKTKLWINIKKGQFMAPWDMDNVIKKVKSKGNKNILITERGTSFGYNNLVVDYRGIVLMLKNNFNVIFDATHSVQLPSSNGLSSGGDRSLALPLAKAAAALGVNGFFFETHPNPEKALCDGPNSVYLSNLKTIVEDILRIKSCIN